MIQLIDAGKTFRVTPGPRRRGGAVAALREVSATIITGEIVGVVGPNGAGKTTLFGLLLGFLEATAGEITVGGLDPRAYVRKHGASYLPERFAIPRDWTVRDALAGLLNLDRTTRSVDDVLAEYELTSVASSSAHTLSRGTMQRLGIAQALASPRSLVVLDEPSEGLDPLWRVHFRESVQKLRDPARVVLLASHDLGEIERIADRVIILHDGAITETIELKRDGDAERDYAIVLRHPHEAMLRVFPSASAIGDASYMVTVADSADLNSRIVALIDAGAAIVSLTPTDGLEERVTRAMRPGAG